MLIGCSVQLQCHQIPSSLAEGSSFFAVRESFKFR